VIGPVGLLLVDMQEDFFSRSMSPEPAQVIDGAAQLLDEFRAAGAPVAHIHTVCAPDGSDAMPHWLPDKMLCVAGTPGVLAPEALRPIDGEFVAVKQHSDGFVDPGLEPWLREHGVKTVVVCGVYTQTCVRAAVLGAYQRGFGVIMATDALGTDDVDFANMNLAWLGARAARLLDNNDILTSMI
jgi:nicotinamidase-related amidase